MIVATEYKNMLIVIVHITILTHKHYRIGFGIEVRGFNNVMGKEKPTFTLISILVADWTAFMTLLNFSAFFDLSEKD